MTQKFLLCPKTWLCTSNVRLCHLRLKTWPILNKIPSQFRNYYIKIYEKMVLKALLCENQQDAQENKNCQGCWEVEDISWSCSWWWSFSYEPKYKSASSLWWVLCSDLTKSLEITGCRILILELEVAVESIRGIVHSIQKRTWWSCVQGCAIRSRASIRHIFSQICEVDVGI